MSAFLSFPSFTWERLLFSAKFYFALSRNRRRKAGDPAPTSGAAGSAMKLPQQVRSRVKLGNEGNGSLSATSCALRAPGQHRLACRFRSTHLPTLKGLESLSPGLAQQRLPWVNKKAANPVGVEAAFTEAASTLTGLGRIARIPRVGLAGQPWAECLQPLQGCLIRRRSFSFLNAGSIQIRIAWRTA